MKRSLTLITIAGLITVGCEDRRSATAQGLATSSQAEPTIPGDVAYSIIRTSSLPGVKRSLVVQLNKNVSEEILRAIALDLKSKDPTHYDRTFMFYYIPGVPIDGNGAWATTHFDPDLDVRIMGLTPKDKEKLMAEHVPANREVIGRWLDEGPFLGGPIMIFREDGKLWIEQKFKDGSTLNAELIESKSLLGRRFDGIAETTAGSHWILDSTGDLQARDNEGLVTTCKKVE